MKATRLKITYDWRNSDPLTRLVCRGLEEHDLPAGGKEDHEKPGVYTCARCGVVKTVKETRR